MKLTEEQKQANKEIRIATRKAEKENDRIEAERNQKTVSCITFNIEWSKSRNPTCEACVEFAAGGFEKSISRAGGWGYDKSSTVIAEIFNRFLKYTLWNMPAEALKGGNGSGDTGSAPYGIHLYSDNRPHFGGGIGTDCYYAIAKYIGGEFKHVASGKTFDVYTITFPQSVAAAAAKQVRHYKKIHIAHKNE